MAPGEEKGKISSLKERKRASEGLQLDMVEIEVPIALKGIEKTSD